MDRDMVNVVIDSIRKVHAEFDKPLCRFEVHEIPTINISHDLLKEMTEEATRWAIQELLDWRVYVTDAERT